MRRSTKSFFQEAKRTPGFSLFDRLHGYVYARWPYFYIGVGMGEHRIARKLKPLVYWIGKRLTQHSTKEGDREEKKRSTFADAYHGKVVPLEAAEQLVTIDREIQLTNLEKIIPYSVAKDIIMKNPDHIVVLDCSCRVVRDNPCEPLDVCLVIGEPFASFVAEHHPNRSRWITPGEAVEILRAEDERGHVHHAFFKDAMLGRFYAICNCCACCCGAMQAHRHGIPMLACSGYVARVNSDLCVGCGTCTESCQFGALSMRNDAAVVDTAVCMGCGVCVSKCEERALSLWHDQNKGEPLEMVQLMERASMTV